MQCVHIVCVSVYTYSIIQSLLSHPLHSIIHHLPMQLVQWPPLSHHRHLYNIPLINLQLSSLLSIPTNKLATPLNLYIILLSKLATPLTLQDTNPSSKLTSWHLILPIMLLIKLATPPSL